MIILAFFRCSNDWPSIVIPLPLLLVMPLIRAIKRKAYLRKLKNSKFIAPTYYNHTNMNKLMEGPNKDKLISLLLSKKGIK